MTESEQIIKLLQEILTKCDNSDTVYVAFITAIAAISGLKLNSQVQPLLV
jgi:hypothetical protein